MKLHAAHSILIVNALSFSEVKPVNVFQDEKLKRLVESGGAGGGEDWKQIATYFTDRSDVQCQHRWQKVLNPELIKGPWTKEVRCLLSIYPLEEKRA